MCHFHLLPLDIILLSVHAFFCPALFVLHRKLHSLLLQGCLLLTSLHLQCHQLLAVLRFECHVLGLQLLVQLQQELFSLLLHLHPKIVPLVLHLLIEHTHPLIQLVIEHFQIHFLLSRNGVGIRQGLMTAMPLPRWTQRVRRTPSAQRHG